MRTRRHLGAGAKLLALVVTGLAATIAPSLSVSAAWSVGGSGAAGGAAAVMPTGLAPTAGATGDVVTVRWPSATLSDGVAVAGYVVVRANAVTGTTVAAGGTCAGTVTTTSCTDSPVPPGSWTYADTPVQLTWTGGESPQSNAVTVPLT